MSAALKARGLRGFHKMTAARPPHRLDSSVTVDTTIAPDDARGRATYYVLLALIGVSTCLPFWLVERAPLVDYPNHLARAYILYHYEDVEAYRASYDALIEPIPNVAIDLIVPLLLGVFSLETASKIFLSLTVLVFAAGCHMLGRAVQGGNSWLALACALFSYNSMLLYGFVNFVFGLGLFMLTLAFWLLRRKDWGTGAMAAACLLTFSTYLSHLSAYCFLALTVMVVTLFDHLSSKRLSKNMALGLVPLAPPLVAFAAFMRGSGEVGTVIWNTPAGKLLGSLSLLVSYNHVLDAAVACAALAVLAALAFGSARVEVMRPALAAGCCFAALFLVCPKVLFTSWAADARFVPPAVILALMALRLSVNKKVARLALLTFLVASLVRLGSIGYTWTGMDEAVASEVEMFSRFKEGDRVYPIIFLPADPARNKVERAYEHSIHYSTIYRHTFSPTLFAARGQQPLVMKAAPGHVRLSAEVPPQEVDWGPIFEDYDYLWCHGIDEGYARFLKERCSLVAQSGKAMIFRVEGRSSMPPGARAQANQSPGE
jgi:hypothetical protein